jgi:hypothetical protein
MKRPSAFMLLFGVYLYYFPSLQHAIDMPSFFPPDLQLVDTISEVLMMKVGLVVALFGFVAFVLSTLGSAAYRVRRRFDPPGS